MRRPQRPAQPMTAPRKHRQNRIFIEAALRQPFYKHGPHPEIRGSLWPFGYSTSALDTIDWGQ